MIELELDLVLNAQRHVVPGAADHAQHARAGHEDVGTHQRILDLQALRGERADLLHQRADAPQVVLRQLRVGDEARPLLVVRDVEDLAVAARDACARCGAERRSSKPSTPVAPARSAIGRARREKNSAPRTTQSPVARSLRTACTQCRRTIAACQGNVRRTMLPVSTTRS